MLLYLLMKMSIVSGIVLRSGWSVFLAFLAGLLAGFLLGLPAASLLHFFFSWGGGGGGGRPVGFFSLVRS